MKRFSCVVALFALTVGATPAGAAGPTKLKQPKSFPITITKSGSYILVSNLTVPDENTTAISVQADYVTIDLNGFSIQGPVVCTGTPVTSCSPSSGTGVGIDGTGHRGLAVRNGSVHGIGFRGIEGAGRVENVTAEGNGGIGILATTVTGSEGNGNYEIGIAGATVSNCSAYGNRQIGIEADVGAVSNSTANNNGEGIFSSGGSASNCSANFNAGTGIYSSGSVTNCTAQQNSGDGIIAKTATGCTAAFNTGAQISGVAGIAGHNICGDPGSPCP